MAYIKIVKISDYSIAGSYQDASPNQTKFGGIWRNASEFEHIEVTGGLNPDTVKSQDDGGGGIELVVDETKLDTLIDVKWVAFLKDRFARTCLIDPFVETSGSDRVTAGVMSSQDKTDWETHMASLRAFAKVIAVKQYSIRADSGQDDIKIEREDGADDGHKVKFEIVDPQDSSQSLSVTVTDQDISVSLATDGGSAVISTIQEVIDEINNDGSANVLITASLVSGATGTDVIDQLQ